MWLCSLWLKRRFVVHEVSVASSDPSWITSFRSSEWARRVVAIYKLPGMENVSNSNKGTMLKIAWCMAHRCGSSFAILFALLQHPSLHLTHFPSPSHRMHFRCTCLLVCPSWCISAFVYLLKLCRFDEFPTRLQRVQRMSTPLPNPNSAHTPHTYKFHMLIAQQAIHSQVASSHIAGTVGTARISPVLTPRSFSVVFVRRLPMTISYGGLCFTNVGQNYRSTNKNSNNHNGPCPHSRHPCPSRHSPHLLSQPLQLANVIRTKRKFPGKRNTRIGMKNNVRCSPPLLFSTLSYCLWSTCLIVLFASYLSLYALLSFPLLPPLFPQ